MDANTDVLIRVHSRPFAAYLGNENGGLHALSIAVQPPAGIHYGKVRALLQFDHRLMLRVQRWRAPRWIRLWMLWATRGGDGWLWYGLGVVFVLFGGRERFRDVGAAMLAASASIALYAGLKRLAGRSRPCAIEPHCWASVAPPDPFSFPSGHSMTAFAIVTPLGLFHPALFAGLLFLAVSVAASRVVLGMHFLSDVVAGSLLGASLGYGAFKLVG